MLVILGVVEKFVRQLPCRILQNITPLDEYRSGTAETGGGRRGCGRAVAVSSKVEEAGQNPSDWAGAQPVGVW